MSAFLFSFLLFFFSCFSVSELAVHHAVRRISLILGECVTGGGVGVTGGGVDMTGGGVGVTGGGVGVTGGGLV